MLNFVALGASLQVGLRFIGLWGLEVQVKLKFSAKNAVHRRRVFVSVHAHQPKEREHLSRYESPHRTTGRFVPADTIQSWGTNLPDDAELQMQSGSILWDAPLLMVNPKGSSVWKIVFLLDPSPMVDALLVRLEAARSIEALAICLEQLQLEVEYQAIVG